MAARGWEKAYILDARPVRFLKRIEISCHDSQCTKIKARDFDGELSDEDCRREMAWFLYEERWHPHDTDGALVYCPDHHPKKEHLKDYKLEPRGS